MLNTPQSRIPVLDRVVAAVNNHDLESLVACFTDDYANVTPVHPGHGFVGRDQVRTNWSRIFVGVPDVRARVSRAAVDGSTVWTEWELAGTRRDATAFLLRGVVIFQIHGNAVQAATFYLEPVDEVTGDADAAIGRILDDPTGSKEAS